MILTLDGMSALRALRVFRRARRTLPSGRVDLPDPSPAPQRRWTRRVLPLERLGLSEPPDETHPVQVLATRAERRPRASFFSARVCSNLPENSFVDLGGGLFVPCPELLFVWLAGTMSPEAHALLGYELCGTYVRDPADARLGETTYGVRPVTSVERILAYLERYGARNGVILTRHNLVAVRDNAWSPMEAIVALLMLLPPHEQGLGFGELALNVRHGTTEELVARGARTSRVPDIEIVGSRVGINYDGGSHLDLEKVARAIASGGDVEGALREVRAKHHDDVARTRELMAQGRVVLPVTVADLFAPGGFDAVMIEVALARESLEGVSSQVVRALCEERRGARERQLLLWSLLPWPAGVAYAREVLERMPWRTPGIRYSLPW